MRKPSQKTIRELVKLENPKTLWEVDRNTSEIIPVTVVSESSTHIEVITNWGSTSVREINSAWEWDTALEIANRIRNEQIQRLRDWIKREQELLNNIPKTQEEALAAEKARQEERAKEWA